MNRPLIKICGITCLEDAVFAAKLGATSLGFIFADSPRRVDASRVKTILDGLAALDLRDAVEAVGVFVNEKAADITRALSGSGIDIVQIHGDERPADTLAFSFPWYRALRIESVEDVTRLCPALQEYRCSRFLYDAAVPGMYGGTGLTVDRDAAAAARAATHALNKQFFIAGGIAPGNVASIIETVQPDGIDVGSGVEEYPGKKSHEKLLRLFTEIDSL